MDTTKMKRAEMIAFLISLACQPVASQWGYETDDEIKARYLVLS